MSLFSGDKDRWNSGVLSVPEGHPEVIRLAEQLHWHHLLQAEHAYRVCRILLQIHSKQQHLLTKEGKSTPNTQPWTHLHFYTCVLKIQWDREYDWQYAWCVFCLFRQELEDFETVSDFEVLMKSSHGPNGSNGPDRDEFNNHKDYNQEKPSKIKQR